MTDAAVIPMPQRTPDSIVGGNVKYLMNIRGVDQATMAQKLEVDQSTVSLKLSGKRKWTVSELLVVSRLFNVSIDSLARPLDFDPPARGGASGLSTIVAMAPRLGLEPRTYRLTADCSAN